MSRILRIFAYFCLICFTSNAMAGGYTCPADRMYTDCKAGYFMTAGVSGTSNNTKYYVPDNTPKVQNSCASCAAALNYSSSITTCPGMKFFPRYKVNISNFGATHYAYRSADDTTGLYATATATSVTTDWESLWTPTGSQLGFYDFAGLYSASDGAGTKYVNADGTVTDNFERFATGTSKTAPTIYTHYTLRKTTCSAGSYLHCNAGTTCECRTCPAGKYCDGGEYEYQRNTISIGITGDVEAGYYSTGGATTSTPTSSDCISGNTCGPVAAGYYSTGGATSSTGNGAVAAGYYSTGGATTSTPTSSDCVSGNTCGAVEAGYYSQGGAKVSNPTVRADCTSSYCGMVNPGYYSTGGGTAPTPTAADNGCLAGYECGTVAAGYYSTYGATSSTGNGAVAAGWYSSGGGTSASNSCLRGYECGPVAAGYYSTGGGKTATGDCVSGYTCGSVSGGYYSTGGGKSLTPTSSDCTSGNTCGAVAAGYYSTGGGTSETPTGPGSGCLTGYKCGTVAAGYYSTGGGKTASNSCLSGYKCGTVAAGYYSTGGGKSVTPTAVGDGCVTGKSCGPVAAGFYSTGGGTSATPSSLGCTSGKSCGPVAAGFYSTGGGTAVQPTTTGKGCLAGYECGKVDAGYYSSGGGTAAQPTAAGDGCIAGKTCGQCNAGDYSEPGASSCSYCSGGTWSGDGASACLPCPAGTYSNARTRSTSCIRCGAGTTSVAGTPPSETACSACSNASNVSSWFVPEWTAETNSATNICQINVCSTGYRLSDNACTACPYTVVFDKNGGSGSMTSQTFSIDAAQNLKANAFTRAGYKFLGWATTKGATTAEYTDGQPVKNLATTCDADDVILYAVWEAMVISGPQNNSKVYDGTPLTCNGGLSVTSPAGAVIKYARSQNGAYSTTAPTITNVAESKTIYYQISATDYTALSGSFECTITKAPNPIILSANSGHVPYGRMITIGVSSAQGELSVASSNTSVATVKLSGTMVDMTAGSSYGTATITVTANGNDNYLAGSKSYTLYVDQGVVTLEPGAGTGGTSRIYHQYNTNVWLSAWNGTTMTTTTNPITIPSRDGYTFAGYYADANSTTALIGANGYITDKGIEVAKAAQSNITWKAKWDTCPTGSFCPSDGAPQTCPANYPNSAAGATSRNDCYLTTTPGKFVANTGAGETACISPYYCPGGAAIYYGGTGTTTGGNSECTSLGTIYTASDAGASKDTQCFATTTKGNWVAAAKAATESTCTNGYWCEGGKKVYYNSTGGREQCPATASGSDNGRDAKGDCYVSCTAKTISNGTTTVVNSKEYYNGTAYPACTFNVNCNEKYGASGNKTTNPACTLCSGGQYSGGGTSVCKSCPNGYDDGAVASKEGDCQISVAGGKYVGTKNSATLSTCGNWTFKGAHSVKYGETSSCESCPSVPDAVSSVAWTKASGTGWSSYSSCIVSQTPANCASGKVQRTASSASTWGNTTLVTTLKSTDGYYAGTSATSCTAAADGKYATAGSTTDTACAIGSYSEKASASSKCIACPAGRTTSGTGTKYNATATTACSATCSNSAGVSSWATPSWSANSVSNLCKISDAGCQANYYQNSNACSTCSSGTNSKYTLSDAGTTSVNSCYLNTTAGNYVATKGAGETACISQYYCPGKATIYYGGTGTTTGGYSECTSLGTIYTASDAGASKDTQCFATTTKGNWVAAAKAAAETTCTNAYWCAGGTKVYYNSTGGREQCPAGYRDGTTGYSAKSQCLMNVAGGKYVAKANESSASGTCALGYAKAAHKVTYGDTSECGACTGATYADKTGQASCSACPIATNPSTDKVKSYSYWISGGGAHTKRNGCQAYFEQETLEDGKAYMYCFVDANADTYGIDGTALDCYVLSRDLTCNGGYYNKQFDANPTLSQYRYGKTLASARDNACQPVEAGYWSANESLTRTACASGLTTIGYGTGANDAGDCGRIFNYGDKQLFLRSEMRTKPSLHVRIGDKTFYGNMRQVTGPQSGFNAEYDGKNYLIVNDDQ